MLVSNVTCIKAIRVNVTTPVSTFYTPSNILGFPLNIVPSYFKRPKKVKKIRGLDVGYGHFRIQHHLLFPASAPFHPHLGKEISINACHKYANNPIVYLRS